MSTALTVGIVGLGYGRAHIPAFQVRGCDVVAVCQRDRAVAKTIADRYGVPQVYERWEEMLDRLRPEIVVIATPPPLHRPIAEAALAAGAHVLCEKPLAMDVAEARAMADAARRAGRVAMTGFNWRFTPAMQELAARVRSGAVGRPFHVSARWLGGRWAAETAAATWRMDRAQAGHGAMGDQGVHVVDLFRMLFGEFRRVTAHAGVAYPSRSAPGVARPADAEDYCTVLAELAGGAEATFTVSRVAHGMNEHAIEAFGSKGALAYRLAREGARWYEGELRMSDGGAFRSVAPSAVVPDLYDSDQLDVVGKATIAPLVDRLLDGIRTGAPTAPSFEDGVRAQAVLDAVLEAVRTGRWVDVPA